MPDTCSEARLRTLPLFSLLSDTEREAVRPLTEIRTHPAHGRIVRAGVDAGGIYLLLSGCVNVLLEDAHGGKVIVDTLYAYDTFSELGLFQSGASLLTFECERPSEVLYVPRVALQHALKQNCEVSICIAQALARRLDSAYKKVGSLAHKDVYTRVIDILLTHGREQDGIWHVEIGSEAIAANVAASREMVSRVLKDLIIRGLARRPRRKLIVPHREALERWASQRRKAPPERTY